VDIALDLFRLDVPQRIGTFVPSISSESFVVIPRIGVQQFRASRVFENIQQYLAFLFEMKKNSSLIGGDDGGHIDELKGHVEGILVEMLSQMPTSSLLRCILVHNDLNDMNILVDKHGCITGIIDWEYQTLQPAVLAADYPQWLSYDACCDPRFADPKQTFCLESPKESKRLRNIYLQVSTLSMTIRQFLI
jgi:Phosphotransferase enzyme family